MAYGHAKNYSKSVEIKQIDLHLKRLHRLELDIESGKITLEEYKAKWAEYEDDMKNNRLYRFI